MPSFRHRVAGGCLSLAIGIFVVAILLVANAQNLIAPTPLSSAMTRVNAAMLPCVLQIFWLIIFRLSQRYGWARLHQPATLEGIRAFVGMITDDARELVKLCCLTMVVWLPQYAPRFIQLIDVGMVSGTDTQLIRSEWYLAAEPVAMTLWASVVAIIAVAILMERQRVVATPKN